MENVRTLLALGAATIGDEDEHVTSILGTAISVLSLESLKIILRHGVNPNVSSRWADNSPEASRRRSS